MEQRVNGHHVDTRDDSHSVRVGPSLWWWPALMVTLGLFAFNAPAVLCLSATVILAVWWCRESDRESR
jgi:hypothetical protein